MFYRYTKSTNPMSDWGHAMFVNNPYTSDQYGPNCWTYDGSNGVDINDLRDVIISTWDADTESGRILNYTDIETTGEDIFSSFNPSDIVSSADTYDSELVTWLWERVLEANSIDAVITADGAIVFDESLIKKSNKEEVQG